MNIQKEIDHKIAELERTGKPLTERERIIASIFFSAGVISMSEEIKSIKI